LDSVLRQTLSELEIICLDDGSTDQSLAILRTYQAQDARFKIFTHSNRGPGPTRNLGLKKATGQFVAFLDSDDYYPHRQVLARLYRAARSQQVPICGGSVSLNLAGRQIKRPRYLGPAYVFSRDHALTFSSYQFPYGFWRFIYQRDFLLRHQIFFPVYRRVQDPIFLARALHAAPRFYVLKTSTYCYRQKIHPVHWTSAKIRDARRGFAELLAFSRQHQFPALAQICRQSLADFTALYQPLLKKHLCLVIPAYKEAGPLIPFLRALLKFVSPSQLIVVNDGSSDQTAPLVATHFPALHLLTHPVNLGKGAAMKTGADYAFTRLHARAVIFMDGDGQHHPADLPAFFTALIRHHAPLVLGCRSLGPDSSMPRLRIYGNKLTSALVKLLFGYFVPDILSGFKAMTKNTYQRLRWQSSDYGVELEIACQIARQRLQFTSVPITTIYHNLDRGMNALDVLKIIIQLVKFRINL
jgi:glycosyltransferase involved in cell wall biosynthesis